MSLQLLLLRHAKSDWSRNVDDFERPLNERGHRDAAKIGRWLLDQKVVPDLIVSSPARRAAQTAGAVCSALGGMEPVWNNGLYLGSARTLADAVGHTSSNIHSLMLIGHNPGLEELLLWVAPAAEKRRKGEKLLTTATLAHLRLAGPNWTLHPGAGKLEELVRARDLE